MPDPTEPSAAPTAEPPDIPVKSSLPARKTGLSPAQQKLQAALAKAAQKTANGKPVAGNAGTHFRAKSSFTGKKAAFQRKAT